MSSPRWLGNAAKVAQVDTLTVGGTIESGDKFLMTINGKTLTVSATDTSATTTATAIAAAWNALTATAGYQEFAEITASPNAGVVTLTADTAGLPFTVTVSTTESDDGAADNQTFVKSNVTASAGPNHWDTPSNWSTGAIPVNSDTPIIENSDIDILYGLDQSSVALSSLTIAASYTGKIGLPDRNILVQAAQYEEYRTKYLTIQCSSTTIGDGAGTGSDRIKINNLSTQAALTVRTTRTGSGFYAVHWKGTHSSNTVSVSGGSVAIAPVPSETATVSALDVTGGASILVGSGVTLTTVTTSGGAVSLSAAATTLNQTGGILSHYAGAITTANVDGGELHEYSGATVTTYNVSTGGRLDFSKSNKARTVTNCNRYGTGEIYDPAGTVIWTNGIDLVRSQIDNKLNLGRHFTLGKSAI